MLYHKCLLILHQKGTLMAQDFDPIADALNEWRETDSKRLRYERVRDELRASGRVQLNHITKNVIRDEEERRAVVARLVTEGLAEVLVVRTKGRPRVDLIWTGPQEEP